MKSTGDKMPARETSSVFSRSFSISFCKNCTASSFRIPHPLENSMLNVMVSPANNLKVFYSVIVLDMVFMMNNFIRKKFSSDMFLHDMTMFKNVFIINPNSNISSICRNFLMRRFKSSKIGYVSAFIGTIFSSILNLVRPNIKVFEALRAFNFNHAPSVPFRQRLINRG